LIEEPYFVYRFAA